MVRVRKGNWIRGDRRAELVAEVARLYLAGTSLRDIADMTGRGYGSVQRMLGEAGVTPRSRGGARPGRRTPGTDSR